MALARRLDLIPGTLYERACGGRGPVHARASPVIDPGTLYGRACDGRGALCERDY